MEVFGKYSELYDLLYHDKNYSEEINYIIKKMNEFEAPSKKILEYGSGTGIHGCLLAEKGYDVVGIELSENMFRKAKSNIKKKSVSHKFRIYNEDIIKYKSKKKFGTVISLFHVISYLTKNEDILKAFENASNHLLEGGLFIFDVWYSPAVLNLKPQNKIKEIENENLKLYRFTEPYSRMNDNIVDIKFKMIILDKNNNYTSYLEEIHSMRYFSMPEIKMISSLYSFEILRIEEFLTGNDPSENTWGVCFILRKKYNG